MECSLGRGVKNIYTGGLCLNPYSNGMLTWIYPGRNADGSVVLILILMECSLGATYGATIEPTDES